MKNTQSKVIITLLVLILGAILVGVYMQKKPVETPQPVPAYSGDTANLVNVSLVPGQAVSGSLTVSGTLTGAYFFEANAVGQVLDAQMQVLKSFPLTATTEWMTAGPISFSGTVDLAGVPLGAGYIRIHNDNPSGEPVNDRYIDIPVVFQ